VQVGACDGVCGEAGGSVRVVAQVRRAACAVWCGSASGAAARSAEAVAVVRSPGKVVQVHPGRWQQAGRKIQKVEGRQVAWRERRHVHEMSTRKARPAKREALGSVFTVQ